MACGNEKVIRMPEKFLRPCAYPMCGVLGTERYCPKHEAERQAYLAAKKAQADAAYNKQRPAYHAWYNSARWRRYRKAFLAKHPWCAACEREARTAFATEVDHIKPHRGNYALFWDEKNHQGLCASCHSKKTFRENGGSGFCGRKAEQPPSR